MSIVALWDLDLGNVGASPRIQPSAAPLLPPPPLEDINHHLHLPGPLSQALTLLGALMSEPPIVY
ncbi:hypothetical protein GG344DRAFT_83796 [Lentinula edodes]|nr:hypothetical protein GG344DRAFT_83796 [Lentinula edodes]